MDGDRKYRQRGYMDSDRESYRPERPRPQGPKLPLDVTGPKLPRLVEAVAALRCFNCSVALPPDTDFRGTCPKCNAALHCCKQCVHFDTSTRFQCRKPIPVRIAVKDQANDCELFTPRITVARDVQPIAVVKTGENGRIPTPRTATDARAAFNSLFKK
jgi:hypothetical protein